MGGDTYLALMDLASGQFYDNEQPLMDAEDAVYLWRYGKLDVELYERLQRLGLDDPVDVAIWVAGSVNIEALWAEIAARRPGLVRYSLKPGDVADPTAAAQERIEYIALLESRTAARTGPLATTLQARGFVVTVHQEIPTLTARLPKRVIQELAERPDVAIIYLAEARWEPELDTAVPASRAPVVWGREITGTNVTVAVLDIQNVQPDHAYLTVVASRAAPNGAGTHATSIACDIACRHEIYRGMAPGARIISAGVNGSESDDILGLRWAIAQGADIVAAPGGFEYADDLMHFTDRAYDHWTRVLNETVVKSAGNRGPTGGTATDGQITSPGKAWNVVTVGGINNGESSVWTDDQISGRASWKNPSNNNGNRSGTSDREKPEVVAVANARDICWTNPLTYCDGEGTSGSAGLAARLVALMIHRNADLRLWPEAVKAIMMASSVHNIEPPIVMRKDGIDDRDGAGALDAALADTVAQFRKLGTDGCSKPCWWGLPITDANLPVGGYLTRSFHASRGERVRVAITWWARADCPDQANCLFDRLDTDLDLEVRTPDGTTPVDWSESYDNNYEIVEFVAPQTGQYTIRVKKVTAYHGETSNSLGIAWVKDAAYLPDLRNRDGWASEFFVRNDAITRTATVNYFDATGSPTPKGSDSCYLTPNQWCWIPVAWDNRIPAGTTGAATVDSAEELSTVVESQHAGYTMAAAYSAAVQPATTAYLPAFYKVSTLSSLFTVHNPAPAAATVSMAYRDRNGADQGAKVVSLPAGGSRVFDPYNCNDVPPAVCGPGFVDGAVRITADQPIAALATTLWKTNDVPYEAGQYNAPTVGRTALYAASQYRVCADPNCGSWILYSATILNNLTANTAHVTLDYYRRSDGALSLSIQDAIPPYGARGYNTRNGGSVPADWFNPLGAAWDGTVRITSDQAVAGVVNTIWVNLNAAGSYSLAGSEDGRAAVIFPLQAKQAPGGVWQRWAALNVMNVGSQSVSVNVHYYDALGNHVFSLAEAKTLGPYQAFGLNTRTSSELNGLPADFVGSAVAQTVAPALIGVANVLYPDRAAVYDGVGR
jgi:hypothetical protein